MTRHAAAAAPTTTQAVAKQLESDEVIAGVLSDQEVEAIKATPERGALRGDGGRRGDRGSSGQLFGAVSVIGSALRLRRAHV